MQCPLTGPREICWIIHILPLKDIYGGLDHRWWYIFIFHVKRSLFNVSLRENYFESWIEWKIMECKSKRKWCYLSRRILTTSEFASRRRAVFISIQRSYSSPIYILFLLSLAFAAFLFLFQAESLNLRFGPGFNFFASDIFFINTNGACVQSLPNEFKYEVNSIWFALLSA
jgi:hypothetical protein